MLVSKTLPQDVAILVFVPLKSAPGSKARANHPGVIASVSISKNILILQSLQLNIYSLLVILITKVKLPRYLLYGSQHLRSLLKKSTKRKP